MSKNPDWGRFTNTVKKFTCPVCGKRLAGNEALPVRWRGKTRMMHGKCREETVGTTCIDCGKDLKNELKYHLIAGAGMCCACYGKLADKGK
jgi:RNase P subunit RPR2